MPRTIVYDSPSVQLHYKAIARTKRLKRASGVKGRRIRKEAEDKAKTEPPPAPEPDETPPSQDGYLSKIAKYVPAETITFTALVFAAFKPSGGAVWWWVIGGAAVNALYLFSLALGQPTDSPKPRAYFYVLSMGAYVLWAMATIEAVQKVAGITGPDVETRKTAVLAAAAFLVPALDQIGSAVDVRLRR